MLKVLKIAEEQVGYLEKATNRDLDSKTANAGYNNYTKYARDLDNIKGFYNGPKQGYPWCECFVDWCMVQAYGVSKACELLCQPMGGAGAGCTQSAQYYKNKGRFFKSNPQKGDQIFFTWGSDVEHTGLVYNVTASYVYTIEGNTNGKDELVPNGGGVYKKSYALNSSVIYGYGRPNYKLVEDDDKDPDPAPAPTPSNEITFPTVRRSNSYSSSARSMQGILIAFGYSVGPDGADGYFGPNTLEAVKKFQRAKGLTVDGICGTNTWRKLLNVTSNVLPTLSKNDIYNVTVKAIQGILMGWKYSVGADGADGYYGNNTYNAVRRFQSNNRLGVDGIVGINTWKKLIGVV